ncbi:MAG: hypothetical protein ACI9S8_003067, partial [Chlamydiales bacterium]
AKVAKEDKRRKNKHKEYNIDIQLILTLYS